jgi:hypothetical protein
MPHVTVEKVQIYCSRAHRNPRWLYTSSGAVVKKQNEGISRGISSATARCPVTGDDMLSSLQTLHSGLATGGSTQHHQQPRARPAGSRVH